MTKEMMSLRALVEKGADAELLREMIGFAAERLMELEVAGLTGAGYGKKRRDGGCATPASSAPVAAPIKREKTPSVRLNRDFYKLH
jgi:hypothetical protein